MRFSVISALTLVGAGMVSALPSETTVKRDMTTEQKVSQAATALKGNTVEGQTEVTSCIGPLLCCSSLATPLDHIVDPILKDLGIDAASIVGSVGLLCMLILDINRKSESC